MKVWSLLSKGLDQMTILRLIWIMSALFLFKDLERNKRFPKPFDNNKKNAKKCYELDLQFLQMSMKKAQMKLMI